MPKVIINLILFIIVGVNSFGQYSEMEDFNRKIDTTRNDSDRLRLYLDFAYYVDDSIPDLAFEYTQKALELAEKLNHDYGQLEAFYQMAVYYSTIGKYYLSINYLVKCEGFLKKYDRKELLAEIYLSIANHYYTLAEYNDAMDYTQRIIAISEELNANSIKADAFLTMGIIHGQKGNSEEAIRFQNLAAGIYKTLRDSIGIGTCYNNIGDEYLQKEEYHKAIEFFNQAHIFYKAENYIEGNATVYQNLGIAYAKLGNTVEARNYFKQAKVIYEATNDDYEIAALYIDLAEFYADIKNYSKAIEFGEKTMEMALGVNAKQIVIDVAKNLSEYYAQTGNYKKAFENHKMYKSFNDTLLNDEKVRQFKEIETKYEIKQKEEEIAFQKERFEQKERQVKIQRVLMFVFISSLILISLFGISWLISKRRLKRMNDIMRSRNTEINVQKKKLQELNHTKDKLFSIIGHDLRNSIGSVYNFIEILLDVPDYSDTENIKYILQMLEKSFGATYNLLENLLYWAKSQQNRITLDFKEQEINAIISENMALFGPAADNKEILLISDVTNPVNACFDYNSMNLVIRNLISNAIKFTTTNGSIKVMARAFDKHIEVVVSDSGRGMSKEIIDNLFNDHFFYSSPGTLEESGSGLGLKLCKEFVERNKGKITAYSVLGEGSTFTLTLPKCENGKL